MKRIVSFSLALILILPCLVGVVIAANGEMTPLASTTIAKTTAYICIGDNAGEIDIDYNITAVSRATRLGVSSITIHEPDGGTYTVMGTVSNGMIGSGTIHGGTYTYKGTSGKTYYADVTFFATIGDESDSKTYTTLRATAS